MPFPFLSAKGRTDDGLYHQLGEITATLAGFKEDLGELKTSVIGLARAQTTSANDRSRQQQIVISRIEAIERTTAGQHASNTVKLDTLSAEITAMKQPVAEFVSMRRRFSTIVLAASAVVGFAWALAEPVYNFLIVKIFGAVH